MVVMGKYRVVLGNYMLLNISETLIEVKIKKLNRVKEPSGTGNRVNRLHTILYRRLIIPFIKRSACLPFRYLLVHDLLDLKMAFRLHKCYDVKKKLIDFWNVSALLIKEFILSTCSYRYVGLIFKCFTLLTNWTPCIYIIWYYIGIRKQNIKQCIYDTVQIT